MHVFVAIIVTPGSSIYTDLNQKMVAPGGNDPPTDAYQASVIPFN